MSVIRSSLSSLATWLLRLALLAAAVSCRAMLMVSTASARAFERWSQSAGSRRAALALAAAHRARAANRWRTAFEQAPLGMAKISLEGRVQEANGAWHALLGEPQRGIAGRRLSAFVYPEDLPILSGGANPASPGNPASPANLAKGMAKAEVRLVCAGGRLRWCEISSSVVRDGYGHPEYVLVSAVDITRYKRSQAALRDLATRDPLSGLANRRWFELQLAQHLRLCAEEGPAGALLVMDVDRFKQVNDTLGHQAGDRLILEVAASLRRHLRDQDVVARLGGDEFAVVLREGDRWAAEAVARKLVLAVRDEVRARAAPGTGAPAGGGAEEEEINLVEPVEVPGLGVSISMGVASFEMLAASYDLAATSAARDALRAADMALYEVKRSGRNGYAIAGAEEGPRHARPRQADVPDLSARQVVGTTRK